MGGGRGVCRLITKAGQNRYGDVGVDVLGGGEEAGGGGNNQGQSR